MFFRAGFLITSALVTFSAGASSLSTPDYWPSNIQWHSYEQTAFAPESEGKVKFFEIPGYIDGMIFDSLPLQHAIIRVRGDGSKKIAVFSDPFCPYSRLNERTLAALDNVTLYTFPIPLLNKERASKNWLVSEQIYCQATNQARARAYEDYFLAGKMPEPVSCSSPIGDVLEAFSGVKNYDGIFYSDHSPITVFDNGMQVNAMHPTDLHEILLIPQQHAVLPRVLQQ